MKVNKIDPNLDDLHLVHFRKFKRIPLGVKLEFECAEGFYLGKLAMYLLDASKPWESFFPKLTGFKHPTVEQINNALFNPLLAKVEKIKRRHNKPDLIAITNLQFID